MSRLATMKKISVMMIIVMAQTTFANNLPGSSKSIMDTSVSWLDEAGKTTVLASAPEWDERTMQTLFDAYKNPGRVNLSSTTNPQQYNVQFINALWGPLNNPFSKFPRPAKVFLILPTAESSTATPIKDTFYMAPLIKNVSDGNYYVFDNTQKQPVLLNNWVSSLTHSQTTRFNVCNGYGNTPADSCTEKSYQSETREGGPYRLAATLASSQHDELSSARRDINQDWHEKINEANKARLAMSSTIYSASIAWDDEKKRNSLLSTTTDWSDYKTIKTYFEKIRDIRYFSDERVPGFLRRITWLYPDDGCWTRASAVIRDLFGPFNNVTQTAPRPSKIFVFGNLCVNSANSPNGRVSWWYHTAPIVQDAQTHQTYVLDPAIDPSKPLPVEQWMATMNSQTGACGEEGRHSVEKFNICNGYGSSPYDDCANSYSNETNNMLSQSTYRAYERSRQTELGRDANKVLGDTPPWANSVQ